MLYWEKRFFLCDCIFKNIFIGCENNCNVLFWLLKLVVTIEGRRPGRVDRREAYMQI